jgi:hypothetical protein
LNRTRPTPFEPLESRRLISIDLVGGGTLLITGIAAIVSTMIDVR